MFDLLDCLILQDTKQIDYRTALKLNSRFGSLKEMLGSSQSELEDIFGKNKADNIAGNILELKNINRKNYAISINSARSKGIQMYCIFDDEYPEVLKELEDPPLVLYIKGEIPDEISRNIAIIGARNTTYHGNHLTRDCSKSLAENGYVVVSGLARGADTAAHLGALDGGGKTIAVLGGGIDEIYPPENDELTKDMLNNGGALISESPPGTKCQDLRLNQRTRLISCLSKAVIATEVKEKTETSIAVQHAVQLNRKIFVIPALRESCINYTNYQKDLVYLGAVNVLNSADVLKNILNDTGYIRTSDFFDFINNDFKIDYNRIQAIDPYKWVLKERDNAKTPETPEISEIPDLSEHDQNLDTDQRFTFKNIISSTKKEDKRKGRKKHLEDGKIIKLSMYSGAD